MLKRFFLVCAIVVFFGVVIYSQQILKIESYNSKVDLISKMKPVNAKIIKPFLFGHEAFYADLFLIQCLRWYDEIRVADLSGYIYKMLDLVTDLDPRFEQAYIWASPGILYSYSGTMSYKDKVRAANQLLIKGWDYIQNDIEGWKHLPYYWMIPQAIAFNYGYELQDKDKALEYTRALMTVPNIPAFLKTWVAGLYRNSGQEQKGVEFLENLLAIETIQKQIDMVDDQEAKTKLQGKLLAFYKKLDSDDYGRQRMSKIQEQARRAVDSWRKNFPFLPFNFYTILQSREDQNNSGNEMYRMFFPQLSEKVSWQ